MLFVQIDLPESGDEIVFIATGEPEDGIQRIEAILPGRTHATEVSEYLKYWNDDYCYYDGPESRTDDVHVVAARRDPHFREESFDVVVAAIRRLLRL